MKYINIQECMKYICTVARINNKVNTYKSPPNQDIKYWQNLEVAYVTFSFFVLSSAGMRYCRLSAPAFLRHFSIGLFLEMV